MYQSVPPEEIESRSLSIIDAEVSLPRPFAGEQWEIARRMVHTTADFDLLQHIRFHPEAVAAGKAALRAGADIVTDTRMALAGIPLRRMTPLQSRVRCLMDDAEVAKRARLHQTTRAQAAVDAVLDAGGADIFVIGNAPTALHRLLQRVQEGAVPPRLVIGMPVGFVNAEEAKAELLAQSALPYVTIAGRKGGSALAACVVNALAEMVLRAKVG